MKLPGQAPASTRTRSNSFLAFNSGSPVGTEEDGLHTIESDFGGSIGGRAELARARDPLQGRGSPGDRLRHGGGLPGGKRAETARVHRRRDPFARDGHPLGELAFGELDLTRRQVRPDHQRAHAAGHRLRRPRLRPRRAGQPPDRRLDLLHEEEQEAVDLRENGYLPGFDYGPRRRVQSHRKVDDRPPRSFTADGRRLSAGLRHARRPGSPTCADGAARWLERRERGPLWFSNFSSSRSFDIERDLTVYQINGDHRFDSARRPPLQLGGQPGEDHADRDGARRAHLLRARQRACAGLRDSDQLSRSRWTRSCGGRRGRGRMPGRPEPSRREQRPALQQPTTSTRTRTSAASTLEYEFEVFDPLTLQFSSGGWFENATRDVKSKFLREPRPSAGSSNCAVSARRREELGRADLRRRSTAAMRDGDQRFQARDQGRKRRPEGDPLGQDLDLLGGLRLEDILIESNNEPFTGGQPASARRRPSRMSTSSSIGSTIPFRGEVGSVSSPNATYNDQLLGIDVPLGPCRASDGNDSGSHSSSASICGIRRIRPTARPSKRSSTARSTS